MICRMPESRPTTVAIITKKLSFHRNAPGLSCVNRLLKRMKKLSIACGLLIASGSLFAQQYTLSTVAGTGTAGYSGDGGNALFGQFSDPLRLALDSAGNVYVTDLGNHAIREISVGGTVTTIAGNGSPGYSGDGGQALGAQLASPHDIAIDGANNLYIADTGNARVRIVSRGTINTFAGTGVRGVEGANLGDGGQAANAQFIEPTGVAVDPSGNVYISDVGNATVRKVTPNGIITTFAGTGSLSFGGFTGEGGPATQALLGQPYSLTTDSAGNVYIVDIGLSRLFRVGSDGLIHTVNADFVAENCVVDAAGNIYTAAYTNNTVQEIIPNGTTLWIGGNGISGYVGDGQVATSGSMGNPYGVAVDNTGHVYVAEGLNAVIRELTPVPFSIGAVSNAATNQPFVAPLSGTGDATVPISPGEIVTLFGVGLGPANLVVNAPVNGYFPTSLAGTTVSIGGVLAPIIYTSATLVSAIVPYEVSGMTTANVFVTYQGQNSVANTVPVAATAPGLFTLDSTGAGQALAVNLDASLNTASHPTPVGNYLILYATGEGQTSPGGVDGKLAPATTPEPMPLNAVTATVNGIPANINYAGAAPGFVAGVMQVNLQIPSGVLSGTANVQIITNTLLSPIVTIAVQ
jgi:uncharacterized protein (TIGR03437 family)